MGKIDFLGSGVCASGLPTREPFSYLKIKGFAEIAETALAPSAANLAEAVDPDLRPFFEEIYSRPEMTDLVWLNMFRILATARRPETSVVSKPIDS